VADLASESHRWSDIVTVAVITDSAATVPAELAERLGIVVIPLRLEIGGRSYRDLEVTPEAVLEQTEETSTSGPSPADFLEAIETHATSDGAVVTTVARDLAGGSFVAAVAAARLVSVPTRVVDTASAAGGEGLAVLAAAREAAAGGTLDDVERVARHVVERVRLVAWLPNLDHLVRSGHVPGAAAWAARSIGLRPVIELRHGRVSPLRPALNEPAAHRRVLDALRRSTPDPPTALHIAALHSLAPAAAEQLLADVRAGIEPATAFVGSFGSVMLVHAGPGVVGLAWWWTDPARAGAGPIANI
jgi:DegV family protein with EDD domain